MKKLIFLMAFTISLYAISPIMLPLTGIEVEHIYSNDEKQTIVIQREVHEDCLHIAITPENFQSENLASKEVSKECKKTFITNQGMIQPLIIKKGVKTIAELEVLDFIANKSSKKPNKYILVDSRTNSWFDAGTIPSAVNIPYDEFEYDGDFEEEYKRAYKLLGVKILDGNQYDFTNAKTALFFCNGPWCAQSPRAIKHLVKIGYPREKILWYRGGIASWAGLSLSLTKALD